MLVTPNLSAPVIPFYSTYFQISIGQNISEMLKFLWDFVHAALFWKIFQGSLLSALSFFINHQTVWFKRKIRNSGYYYTTKILGGYGGGGLEWADIS